MKTNLKNWLTYIGILAQPDVDASPYHVGAVKENHYHSSSGYTVVTVIAAHPFLLIPLHQGAGHITPGPIQVGPETVYWHYILLL